MPKKKLVPPVPADSNLPVPEAPEAPTVPEGQPDPNVLVAELPDNAHTYYVSKDGAFVKFFTNQDFGTDAKKKALAFAEEIGGTIEASGTV